MNEHKKEKENEEARRLQEEASKIEKIINSDFDIFRNKLKKAKAVMAGEGFDEGNAANNRGLDSDEDFLFGGLDPAHNVTDSGGLGSFDEGEGQIDSDKPRRLNPIVEPDEQGDSSGHIEGSGKKQRPRGGFHIEFINSGAESSRAEYKSDSRTIFINLDHPQIQAAKQGRPPEDPVFRRLSLRSSTY